MSLPERRFWIWLLPLLLAVTWLAARGLDADMLWVDEFFSIGNIGGLVGTPFTPAQVIDSIAANSPVHPPGYFILLSGWALLVGWSPFALRAFSLLAGLLAIAWTYRLGVDWVNARVGLYAAAILSVSALFLYYTHELRMYTLLVMLVALVLWLYRRLLTSRKVPSWPGRIALLASVVSLLYSHAFGVVTFASIGLYHLLFAPKNRRWWQLGALFILAGLLFLPWINVLTTGATQKVALIDGPGDSPALSGIEIVQAVLGLFGNNHPVFLILMLLLAAYGVRTYGQRGRDLWFFALSGILITIAINFVVPVLQPQAVRYLLPLWPPLALLVSLGFVSLQTTRLERLMTPALAVWVVVGLGSVFNPAFLSTMSGPRDLQRYPPLPQIHDALEKLADRDDLAVLISDSVQPFTLYKAFAGDMTIADYYFRDMILERYPVLLTDANSPDAVRQDLLTVAGDRLTVWVAFAPEFDAQSRDYRAILEDHFSLCEVVVDQPEVRIERYGRSDFGCLDRQLPPTQRASFDAGITLHDIAMIQPAANALDMALAWTVGDEVPPETYSVSLKLYDDLGNLSAQTDFGLRTPGSGWQLARLPVGDLTPNHYDLTLTIYDWQTGDRLSGTTGAMTGDVLSIADIDLPLAANTLSNHASD